MRPRLPGFQDLVNEYKEELMRDEKIMKEIDIKIEKKHSDSEKETTKPSLN
ncbi:FbpB family small basic protein [Virgibacillus sp. MSP4-1]|uniref:FbpB family small basic protein n=1 Tax=Virgibacillus sp. MSP4-1 TaxID=2700081 RepID=UPI0003A01FF5|nr:FbpB family small basic protein [Virgibacillus sp. MSP4-1]QHS22083.1 FbpB family small basic protein [Virgibacillus sp. MSP4-1]